MTDPTTDPLTEYDTLTGERTRLEKQFSERKISQEEFGILSKQLEERITRTEIQAYRMARKNEEIAKRLRLRIYNEPLVQQIIGQLVRTHGKRLEPEFGSDRLPKYSLETDKGEKVFADRSILQRLADINAVTETLYERILYCPRCGAPSNVYLRFKCPQCRSIDIAINRMMEHLQCGTIHQETAFLAGKNIICPSCKKLLQNQQEYRLIGIVCSCNGCHAHFEDPSQEYFCRKCECDFTLLTGTVTDVFSYGMTPIVLTEAQQFLGVNILSKILVGTGMVVRSPGAMPGATSGAVFSLLAEKNGKTIAIDIASDPREVEIQPVLEMYAKIIETTPAMAILSAVPRASKRAKDIAALHKIVIVEGPNLTEVGNKIVEITATI
jgi:transposase-like protein